ncbi:MAG TPA: VWA domain-containing protein [Pyrinomonadaceae bacterium]|nr:VWA domain-containing protein [Pyrinomonadaceae bacterium]
MTGRQKGWRLFVALFLLAAAPAIPSSTPFFALAQDGPPPPPPQPVQRLRRVRDAPPKTPASTRAQRDSGQASQVDDDEVVRVDTELANILLTAIDKDRRFVTTLRQEDVRVLEDNVPQELSIFQRETDSPLTLAILIDTSRSQTAILPNEKSAARAFIDAVVRPDRDQSSIISFTGEAVLEQPLTNEVAKLRGAIERVKTELLPGDPLCEGNVSTEREPRCWTGVWDAVWVTVDQVLSQTPEQARRAIIILTDGDDTSSQTNKQEAIDFALRHNVVVYSIGMRDEEFPDGKMDRGALRKVSEKTGGRAFFPKDESELRAAFAQIQQELRSQYLIAYRPANTKHDGSFRQVRIEIVNPELRKQKLQLLYRQGYYARSAPASTTPAAESRPK